MDTPFLEGFALDEELYCASPATNGASVHYSHQTTDEYRDEPPSDAADGPTAEDPFRGLTNLAPIAVIGRDRILELAAKPVRYVWQEIAVATTIIVIAGPPGCGKTTLLFLILSARLNCGEAVKLLEREVSPAPPGRFVVLVEGEHFEESTARKLKKSLQLLAIDDKALDRMIYVARRAVRLGSPVWKDIEELVRRGLVSDIAIDTIARVAPADANDEREQVAIFDSIACTIDLAPSEEAKPTVWAAGHTRKGATGGDIEGVGGSIQRVAQADTLLMVEADRADGRVVATKVTFAKLREDPDEYPAPVTYAIEHGQLRSQGAAPDDGPLEERILNRIRVMGAQTKNALKKHLGRSDKDVDAALTTLFDAKRILPEPVMVNGVERKGFKLREASTGRNTGRHPARDEHGEHGTFS